MREYHITNDIIIYSDMPRGWIGGKYQPIWHYKVYNMWINMWKRVYTEIYYFGSLIDPSFKYLSSYIEWIESQPNFYEFCATCNKTKWSVDKDSKHPGNKNYYPEYMTLMLGSDNSIERNNRNPNPKQPVLGIPLDGAKKTILAISTNDVTNYGFYPGAVSNCITKKRKTHKGYKWYKVNYKHNRRLRLK